MHYDRRLRTYDISACVDLPLLGSAQNRHRHGNVAHVIFHHISAGALTLVHKRYIDSGSAPLHRAERSVRCQTSAGLLLVAQVTVELGRYQATGKTPEANAHQIRTLGRLKLRLCAAAWMVRLGELSSTRDPKCGFLLLWWLFPSPAQSSPCNSGVSMQ